MANDFGFVSYELENDKKLAFALQRAASNVDDLTIPLTKIGFDFRKSRKAIFGLRGPGQYPDLSTTPFRAWWEKDEALRIFWAGGYKSYKEAKVGFAYPILKRTGLLEKATTNANHPGNISKISKTVARFGVKKSVVPYAEYHQEGTSRMPMRKFLFVGPEAPKFAKGDPLKGFPERALNTLNVFILRDLGLNIEQATGTKPKVNL